MTNQVNFDYGAWLARYPEFAAGVQAAAVTGSISANVLTVSAVASGGIALGNIIQGAGVLPGTYITGFQSGSGGTGTYVVGGPGQTVPSMAMTAVAPNISQALAQQYFNEAGLYWRNDGTSPTCDNGVQLSLLNMLTAHLAWLNRRDANGQLVSSLTGPITNATEGSVSVGVRPLEARGTAAWFVLTPYGAEFWATTAAYRTMRYRPGPRRQFNPPYVYPYIPR